MKILKNRIFLSAVCIIVAAVISFGLLPRFYEDKSATIMVLRASEDIPVGTEIKDNHLTTVEVGNYGLPEGVINDKDKVLGKIAQTKIIKGDYFFPQKLGGFLVNELLDRITKNNQRLVTISVPSIAAGLSSHLQNGDIVTVAVFLEQASDGQDSSPQVIIYPELKGLEVYSVENARTQDTAEMREQQKSGQSPNGDTVPKAVTLIVTEAQAEKLIQQLDNLYKQQEAAKSEVGKPFPQEHELKDKISRLTVLDAELNMGVGVSAPQEHTEKKNSKSERSSVLDSLKQPSQAGREIKEKQG